MQKLKLVGILGLLSTNSIHIEIFLPLLKEEELVLEMLLLLINVIVWLRWLYRLPILEQAGDGLVICPGRHQIKIVVSWSHHR